MILAMGGLFLASLVLSNRKSADLRLGDQTFQAGRADGQARAIRARGPIFYSDVSGQRDRDMILQHLGRDPRKGWYAFLAAPPDKPRDCTWQWRPAERRFRARCDRSLTAPADGQGLSQFKVTVTDGKVDVDLNADSRPTATTPPAGTGPGR